MIHPGCSGVLGNAAALGCLARTTGLTKTYVVNLTPEERDALTRLIAVGKGAARKLAHARVLLKADASEGGPALGDTAIGAAVELSSGRVVNTSVAPA